MKKMTLVLLALLCSMQIMAQERVEVIRKKLFSCDESGVIVAAHRGDWRNYPENSLAAIDNAIKELGINGKYYTNDYSEDYFNSLAGKEASELDTGSCGSGSKEFFSLLKSMIGILPVPWQIELLAL